MPSTKKKKKYNAVYTSTSGLFFLTAPISLQLFVYDVFVTAAFDYEGMR